MIFKRKSVRSESRSPASGSNRVILQAKFS
jgi:hypothetical protein